MRTRYLPPGSMSLQRRKGRIEGGALTLLLVFLLGVALVLLTPTEIYSAPTATVEGKRAEPLHFERIPLSPCNDMEAKDCMRMDGPNKNIVYQVPEPSTLWLGLVGFMAAGRRKALGLIAAAWIAYVEWRGMNVGDE